MYRMRRERHLARGDKRERFGQLVNIFGQLGGKLIGEFGLFIGYFKLGKFIFGQFVKFCREFGKLCKQRRKLVNRELFRAAKRPVAKLINGKQPAAAPEQFNSAEQSAAAKQLNTAKQLNSSKLVKLPAARKQRSFVLVERGRHMGGQRKQMRNL